MLNSDANMCVDPVLYFTYPAPTDIYTLSLHDALPISTAGEIHATFQSVGINDVLEMWVGQSERNLHDLFEQARADAPTHIDRKSTRLNSSHPSISYAVFCLKKKKHTHTADTSS